MSYRCEPCQGANPVVMLLTRIDNGSSDQTCQQDMPIMLIGHLAIWLDVDPQRLYDAVERFAKREADREAKQQAAQPAAAAAPGEATAEIGNSFDDPAHPFHSAADLVGDAVLGGDDK